MIVKPTREEARLSRFLSVVALVLAVLTLATLVGAYLGPSTTFFVQPPWVSNTAAALAVLGLLAWFAAADVRRFQFMVRLLIAGLALGALLSVVLLGSPSSASQVTPLLLVAIGGAAIAIGLATALRRTKVLKPTLPWVTDKPLTLPEQVGRVVFGIFGVASLIFAAVLYVPALLSPINPFFTQPVFVAGSTVKISLLGILALTAAYDLRRYGEAVTLLILAHGVSLLAAAISLLGIARFGSHPLEAYGMALTTQGIMQGVVGSDALIIIVFSGLKILMGRAVFDYLGYLGPGQFRTVEALIESILEDPVVEIPPHEAALRVDRYLSSFPSKRLALTRLAVIGLEYAPLACLQPPLRPPEFVSRITETGDRHGKAASRETGTLN